MKTLFAWFMMAACLAGISPASAQATRSQWRVATEAELAQSLPARAPVEKERIETEMRTASGIMDEQGHMIAGVVLITAGYSADGKYSHYLLVGSALRLATFGLKPGKYVFGWKRVPEGLDVHFYDAATGQEKGTILAKQLAPGVRVEAFRVVPSNDHIVLQIGRFGITCNVAD